MDPKEKLTRVRRNAVATHRDALEAVRKAVFSAQNAFVVTGRAVDKAHYRAMLAVARAMQDALVDATLAEQNASE